MLSFIKKIFARGPSEKEQAAKKEMALEELDAWLARKEEQLRAALNGILREASAEMEEAKAALQGSIDALREAELRNPNIPAKALHFMQGNRDSYVKLASLFLRDAFPEGISGMAYEEAKTFISGFRQHIGSFSSSSLKNYQVLQHFFAHESHAVAQRIKGSENALRKLEEALAESGLDALAEAKEEAASIRQKIRRRRELMEETETEKGNLHGARQKEQNLKEELANLEASDEAKALAQWQEGLQGIEGSLALAGLELSFRFSHLEKALRKFAKVSFEHDKLIAAYAEHAEQAIEGDPHLAILSILPKLAQSLHDGSLGLDGKRTQKALDAIGGISREVLTQHVERTNALREQRQKLMQRIRESPVERKKGELADALKKAKIEEDVVRQRLSFAEGQLAGISTGKNRERIESALNGAFSENIALIVDGERGKEEEKGRTY
ncbi:TPA: hypothetical protein HA372_02790 [Candidatus Woesearchaeota archaeon]|nr:hypothetical protein [Candidatus Woesearchaeota archaeon]